MEYRAQELLQNYSSARSSGRMMLHKSSVDRTAGRSLSGSTGRTSPHLLSEKKAGAGLDEESVGAGRGRIGKEDDKQDDGPWFHVQASPDEFQKKAPLERGGWVDHQVN
jgi:hypothetical protein